MRKYIFISTLLIFLTLYLAADEVSMDNLVVLMDCSGSMEGVKLSQAKAALKEVLSKVPKTTNIGILMFGETRGWLYELGPRKDQRLIAAIDNLKASGSTPLGTHMKIAADRLLQQREKQFGYGTYRLLVITDGEANDEASGLVERYTPEIINRGITIDAIGVFMTADHTLAKKVHSYRKANDTESLKKAIYEVLSEVSKTKDGVVEEDAYKVISILPTKTALAILSALPSNNNNAVGTDFVNQEVQSNSAIRSPKKMFNSVVPIVVMFIAFAVFISIISRLLRNRIGGNKNG